MFHSLCPECGRAFAPTEKDCPDCDVFGAGALSASLSHAPAAGETYALESAALGAPDLEPILPVFGAMELGRQPDPLSLNTLSFSSGASDLQSGPPPPQFPALQSAPVAEPNAPDLGHRLPMEPSTTQPAVPEPSRARTFELLPAPLQSPVKLPAADLPVVAGVVDLSDADALLKDSLVNSAPVNSALLSNAVTPRPQTEPPAQVQSPHPHQVPTQVPSQVKKPAEPPTKSYRFRLVPPAPVNHAPPEPVVSSPVFTAPIVTAPIVLTKPIVLTEPTPAVLMTTPSPTAEASLSPTAAPLAEASPVEPAVTASPVEAAAPPDPPQRFKLLTMYPRGLTSGGLTSGGLTSGRAAAGHGAKNQPPKPLQVAMLTLLLTERKAPRSLPSFVPTTRKPGPRPIWLLPYRPSDRLMTPAGSRPAPWAAQCQAVITPPSPMLTRQLLSFQDQALRPVFPVRLTKKAGPIWMAGTAIGFALLGIGYANLVTDAKSHAKDTRPAQVHASAAPQAEPILSAVPSSSFAAPGSLARSIEVSGFRFELSADKKPAIEYIVVNHSQAKLTGLTVYVTLHTADARIGQPPLCQFSFVTPDLGVNEAKQMSSVIESVRKPVTLPDWEDLRAEVQVGQ